MPNLDSYLKYTVIILITGCTSHKPVFDLYEPCTKGWYKAVDGLYQTGDGYGHGPDIGSGEWRSVVEFKMGLRNHPTKPSTDTHDWCIFIDDIIDWKNDWKINRNIKQNNK